MIPSSKEMNASQDARRSSGMARWMRIVALGFVLGIFFVVVNLSVWSLMGLREGRLRRPGPFKLSQEATRRELSRVVGQQLAAFRKDDYTGAYAFAATDLKAKMSADAFEQMVKKGYPAIARSREAGIGVVVDNGDEALVDVAVMNEAGKALHYRYFLLHEDGGWKISGVTKSRVDGTVL